MQPRPHRTGRKAEGGGVLPEGWELVLTPESGQGSRPVHLPPGPVEHALLGGAGGVNLPGSAPRTRKRLEWKEWHGPPRGSPCLLQLPSAFLCSSHPSRLLTMSFRVWAYFQKHTKEDYPPVPGFSLLRYTATFFGVDTVLSSTSSSIQCQEAGLARPSVSAEWIDRRMDGWVDRQVGR